MEFRCRLATASGEVIEGTYVAESEARLRHDLEQKGMLVLSAAPRAGLRIGGVGVRRRRKIRSYEFLVFNQELATLLKAGMPLVQSLDILRRNVPNATFKAVLDDVHDRVRSGTPLSEAFEAHGDLFSPIYTASLLAGERSGGLEQVLRRYVTYVKVLGAIKRKTMAALVYPAILLVLSCLVVAFIIVWVVPQFSAFYESFDAELPLITQLMVGLSTVIRERLLLLLALFALLAVLLRLWWRQEGQRLRFDRALLSVPGLGDIVRKFGTAQLARTLGTLIGGGIPLVSALDTAARAIGNRYISAETATLAHQVREGQPLAAAMETRGLFPDVAVKMVEVGEATGALQDMLHALADFYDEEIEARLGRFVTLVEPALLIIMGAVIATLLLALYFPIFQLGEVMS
ncbi:MAG: type II secretion system F family protein [Luteitalea sp.]|nr:type II secretion system F family protein [Luteitalea sp.]